MADLRIGHGYDVHALKEGCDLIIGGIKIEHEKGFTAHSDGDLLAHAICDALLGALALGDIGKLFPDNNQKYKGADSMKLLAEVVELISQKGYSVVNVDNTIIIQRPKLRPYIDDIRKNIALVLKVDMSAVSVKATTEEKLGFSGEERGASAHTVVLLKKN